jgi:hypothetical protein
MDGAQCAHSRKTGANGRGIEVALAAIAAHDDAPGWSGHVRECRTVFTNENTHDDLWPDAADPPLGVAGTGARSTAGLLG